MQDYSSSPKEMFASIWRNRSLAMALIRREVIGRYRGSIMGVFWSFLNPVLLLVVYTFVFSVVFKAHWVGNSESKTEFALVLFSGLIIFNIFSECFNRAPGLILANVNYVKKVVFPLEILPWVALGSALFHATISLLAWLIAYVVIFGWPQVTVIMIPIIILPLAFLVMGLTWGLAALGVYIRDVSQFAGLITTAMMFLSPIFYSAESLPKKYRVFVFCNPLTPAIEQARSVLFWGKIPNMTHWLVFMAATMLMAYVGFVFFQKTRRGFADVL